MNMTENMLNHFPLHCRLGRMTFDFSALNYYFDARNQIECFFHSVFRAADTHACCAHVHPKWNWLNLTNFNNNKIGKYSAYEF